MSSWYYSKDNAQQGPVSEPQLQELLSNGTITPDSLVWKDGMDDWVPAKTVPTLFTQQGPGIGVLGAQAPPNLPNSGQYIGQTPANENIYAAPATMGASPQMTQGAFPLPDVKPCSFPLYLTLYIVMFCAGAAFFISFFSSFMEFAATVESDSNGASQQMSDEEALNMLTSIFKSGLKWLVLSSLAWIASLVFRTIYVYRAWKVIQPNTSATTPGSAAGFLFIPLFHFYWNFVAYHRWAKEWNMITTIHGAQLQGAPVASEGSAMGFSICEIGKYIFNPIWLGSVVTHLIVIYNMCSCVNYFAKNK